MENRRIGSLTVSLVGLGCNNFGGRLDYERTAAVVGAALDAGITLLDTADIYGKTDSETFLGRALGARRNDIVLATKFGMAVDATRKGAKPDYVRRALDDSLRRLRTDRVDLYQLHEPDASTPIADTLGALDDLVNAGKIREIGCSNFSVPQLREARAAAGNGAKFVSVQNEFSLVQREPEREVLAECEREKLAFIPFFPLASGLLTGKYRRGQPAAPAFRPRRARRTTPGCAWWSVSRHSPGRTGTPCSSSPCRGSPATDPSRRSSRVRPRRTRCGPMWPRPGGSSHRRKWTRHGDSRTFSEIVALPALRGCPPAA